MPASSAPVVDLLVAPKPTAGSVEHYFHFLLGHLIPLAEAWDGLAANPRVAHVQVRSCAVLDPLLLELRLPKLGIVPASRYAQLLEAAGAPVRLAAYDHPTLFDNSAFGRALRLVSERLSPAIATHRAALAEAFSGSGPRIVMIDRGPPDAFYNAGQAEVATAGAQRRSIPNFTELHAALGARFGKVPGVTLEGRSLAYQVALFQHADVVICQHGAALANLVWARAGSRVIEIMPRHSARGGRNAHLRIFEHLAACQSVAYQRLWQRTRHAPVDAARLCTLVAAAVSGDPRAGAPARLAASLRRLLGRGRA